jgi:formate hydrogenlyase subunit 3/multisubunit Na+/H+ antiporter MnhD subunit
MLPLLFTLPLITALICLALSYRVPARWLGIGAAAALLVCGAALLAARLLGRLPLALIDHTWLALDRRTIALALIFDSANWGFALLGLAGGGLALLALALAVPPNVRGFGGLFAAALLALSAVVAGLANRDAALLPFLWALAALLTFLALRASGALSSSDTPVIVLLAGLGGALLALGAVLAMFAAPLGTPPLPLALLAWTLAGMLALGAAPFHAPTQSLAEAPAALAGALLGPGIPLLGGYTLIRFAAGQGVALPRIWAIALTLLGLLVLLGCAAGALATTRLRRLIGWQFSSQSGLVLLALAWSGGSPPDGAAAPAAVSAALLANGALATIGCYLAVAVLERRTGTDDMAEIEPREPLRLPSLALLAGAASAAGMPGTWGLWTRRWLFDELAAVVPWAAPVVLAASALLALAWAAPLALFWRRALPAAPDARPAPAGRPGAALFVGLAAAAPLLILGIAPGLAWEGWLAGLQDDLAGGAAAPRLPGLPAQIVCLLAALLLIALPWLARSRRYVAPDAQPHAAGVAVPKALGESLRGLAWLAAPAEAFESAWRGLLALSRGLRRGMALFEQRYYLAGLLIAVILVIMLFIQ